MDLEKLHIKLGLSGTYWDTKPQYRITVNDFLIKEGEIVADSDLVEFIEFDVEYSTEIAKLNISLLNKSDRDTVQSPDKTEILKDMLLNIESLEIDEIEVGHLIYNLGTYTVDKPVYYNGEATTTVKNCTNLGWNGTWSLTWTNPFYVWLLENI